jgi:hypothetical protein
MRNRQPSLACKASILFVLVSFPVLVRADVADVTLKHLAARSDLIVVARVTKVEDGPAHLQPAGNEFPAVKVATAQVIETWKGDKVGEIRFVASPTRYCDTASAKEGERLVLFLEGSKESPYLITHVGRGRMPMQDADDKSYATLEDEKVLLPKGTQTVPRTKTARVALPSSEPGKPKRASTFKYTVRAIELGTLRKVVKEVSRSDLPASR